MMAWYVFALVDAMPSRSAGKGLTGPLAIRKLAGAFVVVERRADVPPIEFGSLKKHQDVVVRLAKQVPAILPVRFGTLLEPEHLEESVQERDAEIAEAFDVVRDRVQFTWRLRGRGSGTGDRGSGATRNLPKSGAEYLRRAARAANPAPPAAFRALRSTLGSLIVQQRYQPATAGSPEAAYHLVEKSRVDRYAAAADALMKKKPPVTVTGPFPPFAFAPEIL